jgi:hypothetical protein
LVHTTPPHSPPHHTTTKLLLSHIHAMLLSRIL